MIRRMIRILILWLKINVLKQETILNLMVSPMMLSRHDVKDLFDKHKIPSDAIIISDAARQIIPTVSSIRITWIINKKHKDMLEIIEGVEMLGYDWIRLEDYN